MQRKRCVAQLRPGCSLSLSAPRSHDRAHPSKTGTRQEEYEFEIRDGASTDLKSNFIEAPRIHVGSMAAAVDVEAAAIAAAAERAGGVVSLATLTAQIAEQEANVGHQQEEEEEKLEKTWPV